MGNPIIPRDAPFSGERFEAFKELATVSKAHGSLIVAQVSHPVSLCKCLISSRKLMKDVRDANARIGFKKTLYRHPTYNLRAT
jgi:hypothetical protein